MVRRIADPIAAVLCLILFSPILIVACIAVAADGGPIFFRQERVGKDGRIFRVFKLRSMIVNADQHLDENGMPTRKRTTAVGDFIRKTSIDELPQFLNIIMGDMGFIGPRPILPRMKPYMTAREQKRFAVLPGVSGLAQVKGRNHLKWSRRFHYDVIYAERMSLCLDLYIGWQTVIKVLGRSGVSQDRNSGTVDDVTIRPLSQ